MTPRGPDFFVVGAAKSGTTALDAYLGAHPDIFMATKEMHYFGSDLDNGPMFRPVSWDRYLDAFSDAGDAARAGECSPGYLYSKRAAEEIKAYRSDADIIAILRNPVDMIHAFHSHNVYVGDENIEDLEQALAAEPDRMMGRNIPRANQGVWGLLYRDVVRYHSQVKRYFEAFGRDRVHVMIYRDFAQDTPRAYRSTLEFLGVDTGFLPEFDILNANKRARIRTISALETTAEFRKVDVWNVVRRSAQVLLPSRAARQRLYGWIARMNTVYERRKPMPPDLRRRLQKEFAEEVTALGELLGKDLDFWIDTAQTATVPSGVLGEDD